jgi:hypothetical protein
MVQVPVRYNNTYRKSATILFMFCDNANENILFILFILVTALSGSGQMMPIRNPDPEAPVITVILKENPCSLQSS